MTVLKGGGGESVLDVWIASLEALDLASADPVALLTDEEFARFCKLKSGKDQSRFLVSRLLLRRALSAAVESQNGDAPAIEPRDWRFGSDRRGRPCLSPEHGYSRLEFNVSHSGNAVAVAVSTGGRVGVDLERLERPPVIGAARAMHESIFTERELDALEELPPAERWQNSLRFWSVKEAYAKLQGIDDELEVFEEFEVAPGPWRVRRFGVEQPSLHLEGRDVRVGAEQYHLALAAAKPSRGGAQVRVVERLA